MVALSNLKSAGKERKRVGRGGSRGGTSGKGHKGQKARSGGKVAAQFEGGQMPLTRRIPKRGFSNARFKVEYTLLSLDRLNSFFEPGAIVNRQVLIEKGILSKNSRNLIKVLGNGTLEKSLIVHADAFSKSAEEAITQVGGTIYKENTINTAASKNNNTYNNDSQ